MLEKKLIELHFEIMCKQFGVDGILAEAIKNEAHQLSINTLHTYEYCLFFLLQKQIDEIIQQNNNQ